MVKYSFFMFAVLALFSGATLAAQSGPAVEPGSGITAAPVMILGHGPKGIGGQLAQNAGPWPAPRTKPPHDQAMERALRSRPNVNPSASLNEALDRCAKTPACKQQMDAMRGGQMRPRPAPRTKPPHDQAMERALRSRPNVDPSKSLNEALDGCAKSHACKRQMDGMGVGPGRRSMLSRPGILSWLAKLNPLRISSAHAATWQYIGIIRPENQWRFQNGAGTWFSAGVTGADSNGWTFFMRGNDDSRTGLPENRGFTSIWMGVPAGKYLLTVSFTCLGSGNTVQLPSYLWTDSGWSPLTRSSFNCGGGSYSVGVPLYVAQGKHNVAWSANSGQTFSAVKLNYILLYEWR